MNKVLVSFLLMLFLAFPASAQRTDGYDSALDKYESICDRCLELRARVEAGQSVDTEALRGLLAELSSLRKTLSGASGKMSAAQSERFEAIKARYTSGIGGKSKTTELLPRLSPLAMPGLRTNDLGISESGVWRTADSEASSNPAVASNPVTESLSSKSAVSNVRVAVLASGGCFPTPSFGALAAVSWRRVGLYAGYRGNFKSGEYDYVCSSDGVSEYGRVWASGAVRRSRGVVAGGLCVFPTRRLGFYAGAGRSSYTLCWEDSTGKWAEVEDRSYDGFAVDAGLFLTFDRLVFSAGTVSDFSGHADLQIGVGVRF